jgi:hypothetical protein
MYVRRRGNDVPETEGVSDLRSLAERIRLATQNWPESMRSPKPGTDLMWERVVTGQEPSRKDSKDSK